MNKDSLYQKSVAALLLVMVAGISLFFYTSQLSKQKNLTHVTEQNQKNLANLFEQQTKKMPLTTQKNENDTSLYQQQKTSINVDSITTITDDVTLFENTQATSSVKNSEQVLDQFLQKF